MRAAIYIRVSTPEQARDERLSLPMQEERCRAAAEAAGAQVVGVYVDPGLTAQNLQRPGLQSLLADLPRIDVVYTIDIGRLTLALADLQLLRERLIQSGTALVSLDGVPDITTDTGEFMGTVIVAARRHVKAGERARAIQSLNELAARGHHHGQRPLGYERPRDAAGHVMRDAPLVVVPTEAAIVRRIHESYARGASLTAIARSLNADGVPTRDGRTWTQAQVRGILGSPVYRGRVRYNGQEHPATHEPIISEDLHGAVLARLERERTIHPGGRATLCPLLRCGLCGGAIQRQRGGARGQTLSYRCAQRSLHPPDLRHAPVGRASGAVEACIWAWTRQLLSADVIAAALRRIAGTPTSAQPPADLRAELADVEDRITYNLEVARAGGLPADLLARQNAPLLARREELLRSLRGPASSGYTPAELRWLREAAPDLVDRIAALSDQGRQRQFLERLYSRIALYPEGLVVEHRLPIEPRGIAYPRWRGPTLGWGEPDLSSPWQP